MVNRMRAPAAAIAVLIAVNVFGNVWAPGGYLLWAGLGMVGLVLLARADGLAPGEWGLGPVRRRTAMAALGFVGATAVTMVVATRLPGVDDAFIDERVSGMSAGRLAFVALVRAPLATAFFEEVAFRGILLAMLARRLGLVWAVVGSSVAFGVWHLLPALHVTAGNAAAGATLGAHPAWAAVAGMLAAGLAGAFLCFLRIRYDHLVVPIAVHATATSLGYLLAWLVVAS